MTLAERVLWLCSMPSPTGEERAIADAIAAELIRIDPGFAIRRYGNSLVVDLGKGTGGEVLVFAGHLDTVRTQHDGPPRIEGDRIYGCGASDMKSGLALMLDLASSPVSCGASIVLVFYAGEEGAYEKNELEAVLQNEQPVRNASLAVCLEPSDNEIQLGCAGTLQATVTFEGKSAHSARPWQGENAIHKAGTFLAQLAATEPSWIDIEGLRYATVTSATMASAGTARNVIPARFELNINHRFTPGTSIEQAKTALESIVAGRASISIVDAAPSAMPSRNHPRVRALEQKGAKGVAAKQAWTDVGRFAQHGVPAINFGPGVQSQAHQRNEWTSMSQLEEGRNILRGWLGN